MIYNEMQKTQKLKNKVQEKEKMYETLINLCVDGVFIETEKGEILGCNKTGYEMFGYTKEEMLSKCIKDLVTEDFAKELPEIIPDEMTSGNAYVERINKKKDGTLFHTEINTN